jgi:hypothetical protein
MARGSRSPIARADSQTVLRLRNEPTLARPRGEWIDRVRCEDETLGAAQVTLDHEPIARQRLATDDLAQVVSKMLERREAAGLGVKVDKVEAPAALLATAMLADQPIKPALKSTGQIEIGGSIVSTSASSRTPA